MFKLRVIIFISLLVLPTIQLTKAQEDDLPSLFRKEWRLKSLEVIESHLVKHPKCELGSIILALKGMQIFFPPEYNRKGRATSFPNRDNPTPIVFVNWKYNWNEKLGVLTLIHEAIHLTYVDGRYLCGPDRETPLNHYLLLSNPPCRLFGKVQYNTNDIDEDLEEHLRKELK